MAPRQVINYIEKRRQTTPEYFHAHQCWFGWTHTHNLWPRRQSNSQLSYQLRIPANYDLATHFESPRDGVAEAVVVALRHLEVDSQIRIVPEILKQIRKKTHLMDIIFYFYSQGRIFHLVA